MKKIIALSVIAGAIIFMLIQETAPQNPSLSLSVNKHNLEAGEEIVASARADESIGLTVILEVGQEKKSLECAENPCVLVLSTAPKPGVYSLRARVTGLEEGKTLEASRRIVVSERKTTCVDGTWFGSCAGKKPLFCSSGVLEEKCSECGCDEGFYCTGKRCAAKALPLELVSLEFPRKAEAGKNFLVKATLKGESQPGAAYTARLKIGAQELEKNISSGPVNGTIEVVFSNVNLNQGSFDLNLTVLAQNIREETSLEHFEENAVIVVSEIGPPAAPAITSVFVEGDDALISWGKVGGASGYRLYKSVDANPAFISYRLLKEFPGESESGVVEALGSGTHFFVMTATDGFGNESDYSNVETAVIGPGTETV